MIHSFVTDRPGHAVITVADAEGRLHERNVYWPTDWDAQRIVNRIMTQVIGAANSISTFVSDPERDAKHIAEINRDARRYGTD